MYGSPPNVVDYTAFLYSVVGIPEVNLPSGAPVNFSTATVTFDNGSYTFDGSGPAPNPTIWFTLCLALNIVNPQIAIASCELYTLAVYNLAADRLVNYAPDVPNQTYFKDLRGPKQLNLNAPSVGVVTSTFDQGTGVTVLNPEVMKNLTIADLQSLKTPWGRNYLGIAQDVGSIWGVS